MKEIKKKIRIIKNKHSWKGKTKEHLCDSFHSCFNCGSMIPPTYIEKHFIIINYQTFNGLFMCFECFETKQGI